MTVFTAFAYIGAVVAFVVIFLTESHKSTTETLIMTTDNTGHDGYTCQMISKVSTSYEITSSVSYGTSQAFQLINVIESKAEYEADYASAQPCSQPLEFFIGDSFAIFGTHEVTYGGATLYGEDTAVVAYTQVGPSILTMNYTSGRFSTYAVNSAMSIDSIAVDADMSSIFVASSAVGIYNVYRIDVHADNSATEVPIYSVALADPPIILNDNLYNIYLAEHDTFTALDVYSDSTTDTTAVNTTLFRTRAGEYITHAAVYNSGDGTIKVYYINNTQDATVWENGVFTNLGQHTDCTGIAVDGSNNYYYLFFVGGNFACCLLYDAL
jgi:hypothetical protein